MSADLQWMLVRKNSCFLLPGPRRNFSREPNNLKSRHSFYHNGLIHPRTVGVEAAPGGKGVVLVTRNARKANNRPAKGVSRTELKRGQRATLRAISNSLKAYRPDLKKAAMRRASALLKSQKPVIVKKSSKGGKKKE
ncbi:hypothetical protein CAPTEDRAFT_166068 [Capitella teleta]|uniref:Large ribosomal subunit protein eL28 n=1 Tax=Capitella teleta TaxID=283909 RepID=R7VM13_CAPTE|nr:hypothetical protein CAPTEDRAFT_166068 [Capitella teleta]|eukprot:ELU18731.1 hypothetical protein CAPTEDRAFT_166068 [Capitella teleta]